MRVICVEKRWEHHARHSGYDRLADFLPSRRIARARLQSFPAKVADKAWSYLFGNRPHLFDYTLGDRIAEERAYWLACSTRAEIIHVLYGDEQLNTLLYRQPWMPGHIVATFHLPSLKIKDRFERVQRQELARLSGAVVVAASELPVYRDWLGAEKVMFVPHGIDTTAFTPGPGNSGDGLRLLFVGLHMRDFEVAHRVVDRCNHEGLNVTFDVVLPAQRFGFFTGCDNVKLHSGLSDVDLVNLYSYADALFLPLIDATANNAILEALACGTPAISTSIGGIPNYVDASSGWLLPPGDADATFECVKRLANNREEARSKRKGARAKAESLSWERVAGTIIAGYERLLAGRSFAP
jgi:glycosyltransferase involved in cell wall biosynthesis